MQRKLFKISILLILSFFVLIGFTYKKYPILIKWIAGTARIIGKPIKATVYTNGLINSRIKVYHVDTYWQGGSANNYLVSLAELIDSIRISINR